MSDMLCTGYFYKGGGVSPLKLFNYKGIFKGGGLPPLEITQLQGHIYGGGGGGFKPPPLKKISDFI